jgi:hypothetical protein
MLVTFPMIAWSKGVPRCDEKDQGDKKNQGRGRHV